MLIKQENRLGGAVLLPAGDGPIRLRVGEGALVGTTDRYTVDGYLIRRYGLAASWPLADPALGVAFGKPDLVIAGGTAANIGAVAAAVVAQDRVGRVGTILRNRHLASIPRWRKRHPLF